MDFKTFVNVSKALPKDITVMIRGPHGIGKSQCVYQLADHFGLPMMERRLSQMTDGDMIGVLDDDDSFVVGGRKATEFRPPRWLLECVETPHVIFLDEINRATPEVMQAAFQLVLDREIAGVKIHPESRIFAAVNASAEYQVNEMDPALRDRFFIADLEPTTEDWLEWAKDRLDGALCEFVKTHNTWNAERMLRPIVSLLLAALGNVSITLWILLVLWISRKITSSIRFALA